MRIIMVGMSQQIRMVLTNLLFGILLSPAAGLAQHETLHQRFDTVLAQHGIVGGRNRHRSRAAAGNGVFLRRDA